MHELLPQIVFYVFAGLTVLSAFMVVTQNNPVRCILFLVLAFFSSAVLWMLVQAEFLALILVLVYVGAVMTLFLFVVMMLNIDLESLKHRVFRYLPFALPVLVLLVGMLYNVLPLQQFSTDVQPAVETQRLASQDYQPGKPVSKETELSNTAALGMILYTDYVFAFELAAVILLVAIIAAITLAHRHRPRTSKRQDILQQLLTRRSDRVRLVKMKTEK